MHDRSTIPEPDGIDGEGRLRFSTVLYRPEGVGTSTFARCPFPVADRLGSKGRIPVAGTVNGAPFRGMLMPWGDGTHFLTIDAALRKAAGAGPGDEVRVVCHIDREPRPVEPPDELSALLAADPAAAAAWDALAPSHRKAYAVWIAEAKKAETRVARSEKAVSMIRAGKKLK
ncbi:MAG TPA: YdeI/OmpD-associated family protein [Rectinemataceae bacterium]|nr:YdeI/OmpD-associated family protein [Rectinemataceae bacterium]